MKVKILESIIFSWDEKSYPLEKKFFGCQFDIREDGVLSPKKSKKSKKDLITLPIALVGNLGLFPNDNIDHYLSMKHVTSQKNLENESFLYDGFGLDIRLEKSINDTNGNRIRSFYVYFNDDVGLYIPKIHHGILSKLQREKQVPRASDNLPFKGALYE